MQDIITTIRELLKGNPYVRMVISRYDRYDLYDSYLETPSGKMPIPKQEKDDIIPYHLTKKLQN